MGWNTITVHSNPYGYFNHISDDTQFYFVHSYFVNSPTHSELFCSSDYGLPFTAAIQGENLLATQFHPEKSGDAGLQLLGNFLDSIS